MSAASSAGWVAEELRREHPGLALRFAEVGAADGPSSRGLRRRLSYLADRINGAVAIELRRAAVPHAYRVFYRHVGIDPDVTRIAVEAAVLRRLEDGGFLSEGRIADALTIATVETRVPVWALDAAALDGALGLRLANGGERLGRGPDAPELAADRIVVADERRALAPLFGTLAQDCAVTRRTERVALFSVGVPGVSEIHLDEALWNARTILEDE